MPSYPWALVADDQGLGRAVQSCLQQRLGKTTPLHRFAAMHDEIVQASNLLICVAASAEDIRQTTRIVHTIGQEQWPVAVLVVEVASAALQPQLQHLDPYIGGRFLWPEQADLLTALLASQGSAGGGRATPAAALAWRLARQTPSLLPLAETLTLAAAHDVTVLLVGETGTGKTYLAGLIHEYSNRREQRLLVVPCGALAPSLVESEFFGHTRGAFTGADQAKVGKFEAAGGGTLLLDEVDALSLEQQAKLLRVIETGEFEPVGSNDTRHCAARIIAASNVDLEASVAAGDFRRDLYYRLGVLALHLPPLRERVRDIAPLASGVAARCAAKFGKGLLTISPAAMALLESFPWPGNIRQLENVVQQAVLASTGPELLPQHLPPLLRGENRTRSTTMGSGTGGQLATNRDQHEQRLVERALHAAGNCCSRAARELGVSRATLYNKMKKYGIKKGTTAALA